VDWPFFRPVVDRPWLAPLLYPLLFGFAGVPLFFVLSGFCIHLRWAQAAAAGDKPLLRFFPFWKRRFHRLFPPYLAALALSIIAVALLGRLRAEWFTAWDVGLHLLLLHNFSWATAYSFNNPFWTLGIEEQLYLAYFLLVPLRARWGWPRTLAACLAARGPAGSSSPSWRSSTPGCTCR
jgi:peptidoglycan/LPS O-acetylase OafA/YrhL